MNRRTRLTSALSPSLLLLVLVLGPAAPASPQASTGLGDPPALQALVEFRRGESDLRTAVQRYERDRGALLRRYDIPLSPLRRWTSKG